MRRSIVLLASLVSAAILGGASLEPGRVSSHQPSSYAVILILDGARPDYFKLAPMRHLHALERAGETYSNVFVGQEPANTPPSHATIGTGVLPRRHGIQGFWWKNPATGIVTRPTDLGPVQQGALEAVLSQHHVPGSTWRPTRLRRSASGSRPGQRQ